MVRDAEENAESDAKAKTLIEARNTAESQRHNLQKDYDEVKDNLSDDEKSAFEEAAEAVNEAIKGDDPEKINEATQKLFESANPIMAKKQEAEQSATPTPDGDQTIDGEFTEV
jgi:molecular chaperone DnaK